MVLSDYIMNWVYENRYWYVPLHIAAGATSWAWYNYSFYKEVDEQLGKRLKEMGIPLEDIDKQTFSTWLMVITILALRIISGPLGLIITMIMGICGSPFKLRCGLKFSL